MPAACGEVAFAAILLGLLLVYAEGLRPGMILPGTAGLTLAIGAGIQIRAEHPSQFGLIVLAAGVAAIMLGLRVRERCAAFVFCSGVALLSAGSALLFPRYGSIRFAEGAVFGCVTAVLAASARTARTNKMRDLL